MIGDGLTNEISPRQTCRVESKMQIINIDGQSWYYRDSSPSNRSNIMKEPPIIDIYDRSHASMLKTADY